ncbi:MAG: glycosyltransferase family 4 protein [Oscillospiraceae bacterium]|nr:glycosyltransferase family 4 protein [Oscillospiraceae bacterium]
MLGKKKDILFLCQFFHPEYISSAQLPYETLLSLVDAGFQVGALCGYPHEYTTQKEIPTDEVINGIEVKRLKYLQLDRSGFVGRLVNYFSFTLMVFLNLWRLAAYKTVVVYSNPPILPWIVSWAKPLFGCRFVFVSYDLYPEVATVTNTLRDGSMICRLMEHINKVVFRRADRVVALSQEMKDYIAANRNIAPEKITVIPNWYADREVSRRCRKDTRFYDLVGDKFVVSYFGNMGTMQDMQTIVQTIRILKDAKEIFFLFAGHGNKMEKLKEIVREENLEQVKIYDFLHGQDFQDALSISDCAFVSLERGATGLCVPSKTYSYMMQGIPLVAIMDESDIVRDIEAGAGVWVRNGESEKLAALLRSLHADEEKTKQMRKTCRQLYLQKYTAPICTGKYVDLFRQIMENKG